MATLTKAELRDDVLRELSALAAGQVASAEDAALVTARIQNVLEELDDDGLLTWDMDALIPAKSYQPLIALVAAGLAGTFGQQGRQQELDANAERARRRLRRQAALPFVRTTTTAEYF